MINSLAPGPHEILDVAGGTGSSSDLIALSISERFPPGDVAIRFLDYVKAKFSSISNTSVMLVDINPAMLEIGVEKARRAGYGKSTRIPFLLRKLTPPLVKFGRL